MRKKSFNKSLCLAAAAGALAVAPFAQAQFREFPVDLFGEDIGTVNAGDMFTINGNNSPLDGGVIGLADLYVQFGSGFGGTVLGDFLFGNGITGGEYIVQFTVDPMSADPLTLTVHNLTTAQSGNNDRPDWEQYLTADLFFGGNDEKLGTLGYVDVQGPFSAPLIPGETYYLFVDGDLPNDAAALADAANGDFVVEMDFTIATPTSCGAAPGGTITADGDLNALFNNGMPFALNTALSDFTQTTLSDDTSGADDTYCAYSDDDTGVRVTNAYINGDLVYSFTVAEEVFLELVNIEGAGQGTNQDYFLLDGLGVANNFDVNGDASVLGTAAADFVDVVGEEGEFSDPLGALFTLQPGTTYYIAVDTNSTTGGTQDVGGPFDIDLLFGPPPISSACGNGDFQVFDDPNTVGIDNDLNGFFDPSNPTPLDLFFDFQRVLIGTTDPNTSAAANAGVCAYLGDPNGMPADAPIEAIDGFPLLDNGFGRGGIGAEVIYSFSSQDNALINILNRGATNAFDQVRHDVYLLDGLTVADQDSNMMPFDVYGDGRQLAFVALDTVAWSDEDGFMRDANGFFEIQAGTTYYIVVENEDNLTGGFPLIGDPGAFDIQMSLTPTTPPTCGDGTVDAEFTLNVAGSANGTLDVQGDGTGSFAGNTEFGSDGNICAYFDTDGFELGFGLGVADVEYSFNDDVISFRVSEEAFVSMANLEGSGAGINHDYFFTDSLAFTPNFDANGDGSIFGNVLTETFTVVGEAGPVNNFLGLGIRFQPGVEYYCIVDGRDEPQSQGGNGLYDIALNTFPLVFQCNDTTTLSINADLGTLTPSSDPWASQTDGFQVTGSTASTGNNICGYNQNGGQDLFEFFAGVVINSFNDYVATFQVDAPSRLILLNNENQANNLPSLNAGVDHDYIVAVGPNSGGGITSGFTMLDGINGTVIGNVTNETIEFIGEDGKGLSPELTPGIEYLFIVDSDAANGFFDVDLVLVEAQPPVKNDFGSIGVAHDEFYIDFCDTPFDTRIGLYEADGTYIAVNDDGGASCGAVDGTPFEFASLMEDQRVPAGDYFFAVLGWPGNHFVNGLFNAVSDEDGEFGNYTVSITDNTRTAVGGANTLSGPFSDTLANGSDPVITEINADWFSFSVDPRTTVEPPFNGDLGEIATTGTPFTIQVCDSVDDTPMDADLTAINTQIAVYDRLTAEVIARNNNSAFCTGQPGGVESSALVDLDLPAGDYVLGVTGAFPFDGFNDFFFWPQYVVDYDAVSQTGTLNGSAGTAALSGTLAQNTPLWFTFTVGDEAAQCSIADLDGNNSIDVFDLISFLQNFNPDAVCPADAECAIADLDDNDAIDVFDLITFLQNFDPNDPNCTGNN